MCAGRIRIGGTVMKPRIIKSFDSKKEKGLLVITLWQNAMPLSEVEYIEVFSFYKNSFI